MTKKTHVQGNHKMALTPLVQKESQMSSIGGYLSLIENTG